MAVPFLSTVHFQTPLSMSSHRLLAVSVSPLKDSNLRQCGPAAAAVGSCLGRCSVSANRPHFGHFSSASYVTWPRNDTVRCDAREISSSSTQSKAQAGWPSTDPEHARSLRVKAIESLERVGVLGTGGSLAFGVPSAALADVIEDQAPSQALQPTDQLLSVLFTAAFIGLSVLTIGIVYLSVSDFLENRRLTAMQKEAGEELKEYEKNEKVRVGNFKGFGVPKVDKRVEKRAEKPK